uniref:Outer membrane protein beta-barrel domain-containing protein n=1 Tax=uncultured bacterium contig00030 TaxID=1181519 RepID=A0A806K056_9BACT|nr:hypothetical protein [uncultured bacterium contig00030]
MPKAGAFFIILLLAFTTLLYAQEDDGDAPFDDDWDIYAPDLYGRGDQTFIISLGTVFPTVFINNGKAIEHNFSPPVGGTLYLSYNYFFNSNLYTGGEVSFLFMPTLREKILYVIPFGARIGYQFNLWRFEFPLTYTLGMVWHRYDGFGYYGLYMKAGGAAYYRFSSDWSFGITANWLWLPQWTRENGERTPHKDVYGNVVDVMLSARYHF